MPSVTQTQAVFKNSAARLRCQTGNHPFSVPALSTFGPPHLRAAPP